MKLEEISVITYLPTQVCHGPFLLCSYSVFGDREFTVELNSRIPILFLLMNTVGSSEIVRAKSRSCSYRGS